MKRFLLFAAMAVLVAFSTNAFAAGALVKDKSKSWTPIQSVQGVAPEPAASACTTASGTKGTIVTVNPAGYIGLKWSATDADGAPVIVKRRLNSNTAYMPESSGTMTINSLHTGVAFDWYSSATVKTTTICRELQ